MQSIAQFVKHRRLIMRLLVGGIVLTLVTIVGGYWLSRGGGDAAVPKLAPVAKDVQQQASGYTFTRSDEGRQVFTIHASRTVAFKKGGATVLEGVQVEIFGRDGLRRDVLRTGRCDYNSQTGDLFSSGQVEIELGAPRPGRELGPAVNSVMLETSQLYFRQKGSVVESEAPVRFRYGSLVGSAIGLRYLTKEGGLELLKAIHLEFQAGTLAGIPVSLASSHAQFQKERGEITFSGGVEVTQGRSRATATSARLFLDAHNQLERAEFTGPIHASEEGVSAVLTAQAASAVVEFGPGGRALRRAMADGGIEIETRRGASVSRMTSQRIEIAFVGVPSRAHDGLAAGDVRMTETVQARSALADSAGKAKGGTPFAQRTLSAAELRFSFVETGKSLKDAETIGPGTIVLLPQDPNVGARTITAGMLRLNFGGENQLETLRGEGGTRVFFEPGKNAPGGSPGQEATADRLLAKVDPRTESIETVEQEGHFHFREEERHATADKASYQAARESLVLTGKPQVWDSEMRTRANTIRIDLAKGRAEGLGKVESTHKGSPGRGEPTSVLADRVIVDRKSQTVEYEGNVRAWQGSDVVESAELKISQVDRRVSSGSQVRTSHLQPGVGIESGQKKNGNAQTRPATIRADHLEYSDQGRKAVYRGNVRMQTENTVLEAERLDAYFEDVDHTVQLERAVAEGNVKVTQPGRRATGQHAEYVPAEGKIVLTGGPPTLYDAEKGFTSGQSLTFYSRDDRLIVSGGDEFSTISRHRIGQ